MSTHTYPRTREGVAIATDVLLVAMLVAIVVLRIPGIFAHTLAVGIVIVLALASVTLHHPRKIEIDEEGVVFHGYGRAHRYAWADVERVHVRGFVVSDRVLVRISPSPPWRGRYWIHETMTGYRALVDAFARRSTPIGEASRSSS